jgi:hypothetical protein
MAEEPRYGFRSEEASQEQLNWLASLKTPGCIAWALALLLVGGIIVTIVILSGGDDPDPPQAGPSVAGSPSAPPATSAPAGCADATADLRGFARDRAGERERFVVEAITRACWDASGELRAGLDIPADVEAGSAPMRWLCGTLTDFVADSGRPWAGFTATSSSRLTPDRPLLVKAEPDGACTRPGN